MIFIYRVCETALTSAVDDIPHRKAVSLAKQCFHKASGPWNVLDIDISYQSCAQKDTDRAIAAMAADIRTKLGFISLYHEIRYDDAKYFYFRIEFMHEYNPGRMDAELKHTTFMPAEKCK